MEIIFDINKDELPIFLAEVDEHLQVLDNVLIRIQKETDNTELLQTVFRSAHTIKGMAGMIGHRRMTEVTHALENVLDGVRKSSIRISTPLINLCLKAIDCLRLLREEVATSQVSDVDIAVIVSSLKDLAECREQEAFSENPQSEDTKISSSGPPGKQNGSLTSRLCDPQNRLLQIHAKIDTNSMASAARAFQLMLALQDMGEIRSMIPTQEQIEIATSVSDFAAQLDTDQSLGKVSDVLSRISGILEISIDGAIIRPDGITAAVQSPKDNSHAEVEDTPSSRAKENETGSIPTPRDRRAESTGRRISDLTFRMSVEHMDHLMNLVGELIIDRNHLKQIHSRLTRLNSNYDQIFEAVMHLGQIADQLQEEVMSMRMLPIGNIFNRFPRMIHDMSQKVGKRINVVIRGEDTEMDRLLIEEIYDPLIHLVRNSVDHGIELPGERLAAGKPDYGTIMMAARHEQGRIILTVEDDGAGIDSERLRTKAIQKGLISAEEASNLSAQQAVDLMFLPGLSTSAQATEFSGRGVGLDIVKTNIQHVSGSIQVQTSRGQGTQFEIVLPLTLAIVPSLLVRVGESIFAIPMVMIIETLRLEETDIQSVCGRPVILLRGNVLPLLQVSDIFNLPRSRAEQKHFYAVVIQSGKQQIGLIVDSLMGEEDVVVKPLGSFIGDLRGVSSAAILGSGQVALNIDVFSLFKLVGI